MLRWLRSKFCVQEEPIVSSTLWDYTAEEGVYDDDCGTDSGCSCGDVYLAEEEGWDGVDLEAYKAHLVTAVWGAL